MEDWKPSPLGPPHLQVSNTGAVRTTDRLAPSKRDKQPTQLRRGKLLSPWIAKTGYLTVSVKEGEQRKKYLVHRLVAAAFCEGYDDGLSVNHIDGNKQNNNPSNLEWVTLEENTALAWRTGQCKPINSATKLNVDGVLKIRAMLAEGARCRTIAKRFDVSPSLIYGIRGGTRWKSAA